jgi:putative ABC transport system permease protein
VLLEDDLRLATRSLATHRARTWLTVLAMALGTAAVVLLSALGEGARHYVVDELAQLGTHLVIVLPGRNETTGGPPPLLGETPRDLTLDDAIALGRSRLVKRFAPIVVGSAPVSVGSLSREVTILGSTSDFLEVRKLAMAQGRFLPPGDPARGRPVVVLGEKLSAELFGRKQALGQWLRIGDRRFRVAGILGSDGESLGMDLGDLAIVPVASAQALFDSPGLFRILVQASSRSALPVTKEAIRAIVQERHEGEDDVTIITQDALLSTFDRILGALTLAVAGIAAISLVVAGVLIMNVMLVTVSQRTSEVGLLKALGAAERQILALFLTEALLLAAAGTLAGLLAAFSGVYLFNTHFQAFTLVVPLWSPLAAAAVSVLTGLVFGLLPALRAARLDPVVALSGR